MVFTLVNLINYSVQIFYFLFTELISKCRVDSVCVNYAKTVFVEQLKGKVQMVVCQNFIRQVDRRNCKLGETHCFGALK